MIQRNIRYPFLAAAALMFSPNSFAGDSASTLTLNAQLGGHSGSFEGLTFQVEPGEVLAELLFPETGKATLYGTGNADPWMNLRYELENTSAVEQFFSVSLWMTTEDTSGPTTFDSFIDLALTDIDENGVAYVRSSNFSFTAVDDHGGDDTWSANLGRIPPPGFETYSGEGIFNLVDTGGIGPDNSAIAGSLGYNFIRFLASGYISAGDSLVLTGQTCYANDFANCPSRFVLSGSSAVPLPATGLLLFPAIISLAGFARTRTNPRRRICI